MRIILKFISQTCGKSGRGEILTNHFVLPAYYMISLDSQIFTELWRMTCPLLYKLLLITLLHTKRV